MRVARTARRESSRVGLALDPAKGLSLQNQLRQQLVEAIGSGAFGAGGRLPSSRKLARELGVARNTVVLAYQQLIDEGHIVARERSGLYVNDTLVRGRLQFDKVASPQQQASTADWRRRFKTAFDEEEGYRCPPDWQKYPYPFVEGRFDTSLFPIAEWREANRLALGLREVHHWATDSGTADDPMLIEEIRTKVLPRRGIKAQPNEILVTAGSQQGLFLLTELFVDRSTTFGLEEPGNPQMRALLHRRGARIAYVAVDEMGAVIDGRIESCDIVYVTPSHQRPTAVTLPLERRRALLDAASAHDVVVIEDDFECETNYLDEAPPALRGMPGGERVVYVANLSRVLAPGLRLGFVVASPDVIEQARRLRALVSRHPPLNNQRTAALFLSLGHYDATMLRLGRIFRERLTALRDALNHYFPQSIEISPVVGGTTYWVRGPEGLDAQSLSREAEARGILIEPVLHYYAAEPPRMNVFRMGVTGIPTSRIRSGVEALSQVFYEVTGKRAPSEVAPADCLTPAELRRVMPGATFLYKTVYGEPCTIEVQADGPMVGRSGYANEDRDTGKWWIEDDFWCRQWNDWAYGEVSRFRIRLVGERIQWVNARGSVVDSGVFVPAT
jgi:GntR family transcriptional regulator/MocR family aminotransferase